MSLALGKNSANSKQPLHLDSSNHLLVNDSVNKAVLETIATNTANINVNVGDVEINVADLEALQATTNAKLIEISGKNTDIDNSVKANAITVAKLNQILTKNTEIDTVLDSCSAKLSDVDDSVKANSVTVAKLNQILTKNTEIDTVLDSCSAKLSDIDTTAAATATILRPYLIEGNASTVLIKNSNSALVSANHTDLVALEASLTSMESKQDTMIGHNDGVETILTAIDGRVDGLETLQGTTNTHLSEIEGAVETLEACVGSNKVNVNISSGNISGFSTSAKQDTVIGHLDGVEGKLDALETTLTAIETDQAAIEVLLTSANTDHAANEALLTTIDEDTNNIKTSTASCATDLAAIEVLLTSANTDHAANEALLTTIDADTNNIKTSTASCATDLAALEVLHTATNQKLGDIEIAVQLIDDAIKTEDLAHSSGDKGIPCLMVRQDSHSDLAANGDYMIPTINANGEIRVTSTAASGGSTEAKQDTVIGHLDGVEGKLDALETTLTAIETDQAAIEVLLTSANTDHAANEALLTTIDADTNNIKTSTASCATDLAAIEVLITAGNGKLDEIEGAVETIENCVKTEDLAHSSGDKGFMIMGVRNSDNTSGANFGTQNGDYCPFSIDDDGGVRVHTNDAAMEVVTLMSASVAENGGAGTSSVFTKPRGIKDVGFAVVAASNASYSAVVEFSVDNTTFFQDTNLNFGNTITCKGTLIVATASWKYYRVKIVNNHNAAQAFVVKISY